MARDDLPPGIRPEALLIARGRIHQRKDNPRAALADFDIAAETAPYLIEQLGLEKDHRDLKRRLR